DGGPAFADELAGGDTGLRARIVAPGWLPARDLSLHLQAADVAVQPYPDGASARRTTLMALLSHGVATVTSNGRFTEDAWAGSGVPLVSADDPAAAAAEALRLLGDAGRRARVAAAGAPLYAAEFAMQRTVDALLDATPPAPLTGAK
ncbi:MAG TPA: glycosyltransferase, partial [Longimicrobiaceae bacterium]|nr:glycosyltransferase [Longimicrobiaceae bacterium]